MTRQPAQTDGADAVQSRDDVSRQQFLQTLARGGFMASIMGVGAMALHGTREVSECFNHNYCDSCWQFNGCSLPEKKEAKDERTEEIRPA